MKYLRFGLIVVLLISCRTKNVTTVGTSNMVMECPENGECSFDVLKDKKLQILKDNIGETYPSIEQGENIVLKFEYKKRQLEDVVDSHYIEQILLEINIKDLEIDSYSLKKQNILFARLCNCRGQTGYYRVSSGHLVVKKLKDNKILVSFDFSIEEVSHVLNSVRQTFLLN